MMEVTRKPHLHRDWIDSHAYGIVKALQKNGFTTYLVGGCVRDLLLGIHPKDYDIATAAHPPQVKRLIYNAYIIGKRFRLVLVKRDDQQFEVATFRREVKPEEFPEGTPFGDNFFGNPEEDAVRRDFTINGLFYDPVDDNLIDFVNGLADIDARILRMIGDPDTRLIEDPIRTLRGLRLSHKLGLMIEPNLRAAMERQAHTLQTSVLPRRREEILKILRLDAPELALLECYDLGVLKHVIPTLHDLLSNSERRDLFFQYFEAFRPVVTDPAETTQLFAWLVYSMLYAAIEGPSQREEPITIEDEVFQNLMHSELGMHRLEQTILTKAIEILPALQRAEDFKRRGERRQLALMRNDGYKLALRFAEIDYLITPAQKTFWLTAYEKLARQLEEFEAEDNENRRKRRPRRRKPGERRSGEKSEGGQKASTTSASETSNGTSDSPAAEPTSQSETNASDETRAQSPTSGPLNPE